MHIYVVYICIPIKCFDDGVFYIIQDLNFNSQALAKTNLLKYFPLSQVDSLSKSSQTNNLFKYSYYIVLTYVHVYNNKYYKYSVI